MKCGYVEYKVFFVSESAEQSINKNKLLSVLGQTASILQDVG